MRGAKDPEFVKRSQEFTNYWGEKETKRGETCHVLHMQGVQYCQETSLHGFQYLTHNGILVKICWFLVLGIVIAASVPLMIVNIKGYFNVGTSYY